MKKYRDDLADLERKDEGGTKDDAALTKKDIKDMMGAFEEFKATNDARLAEIEKKGESDVLVKEKLDRIEGTLDKFEDANQKLTLLDAQQKAIEELTANFGALETALKRTSSPVDKAAEQKAKINDWGRAVVASVMSSNGGGAVTDDQKKALSAIVDEYKALNVSTNTDGGYLAPIDLIREIIKGATEISPVRSLARVRQTAMRSVEIPKRTGQFAAQWVSELGSRTETTGLTYGNEEIPTHEFFALIDMSNQLLEDSMFDMEAEIQSEASEQFALAEGTAFVSGNGVGKPQGFLDTNSGVGTTNSGAATTVTADGLISLKYAVKTVYTRNANFVMNRQTLGSVRKLKDQNDQYLWMPGLAQGRPNTIDGDPYVEMPDMPNEAASAKPVAYGDFRRGYTWIDRISMEMLRDPYTQATGGKVRYIMRKRVGGQVTLAEAIRIMVCSA